MKKTLMLGMIGVLWLTFGGMAATLSGSWDTDVTIDPQQTGFNDSIGLVSVLTVAYSLDGWTFTSITDLDDAGWTDQDFVVAGVLGAFTLTSALGFDPAAVAFDIWNTTASVSIAGVSFAVDFTLEDNDVTLVLSGSAVAGDVTVGMEASFGGDDNDVCDLNWADLEISLGFTFGCMLLEATVSFDCDGFENIVFTAEEIVIPDLLFLTLDVTLEFTLQDKFLTLSPSLDFGLVACFDLYVVLESTGGTGPGSVITIDGITIDGIGLTSDIGIATFTALSYWGSGTKPGLLAGTPYWEVYAVSSNEDICCGPFGFDLAVYFLDAGSMLFDVALIEVDMTVQVASQFAFNMGMDINVEIGAFTEWAIGFLVTW